LPGAGHNPDRILSTPVARLGGYGSIPLGVEPVPLGSLDGQFGHLAAQFQAGFNITLDYLSMIAKRFKNVSKQEAIE
jgi:hypothetical protein